jgi:hypothetical protein
MKNLAEKVRGGFSKTKARMGVTFSWQSFAKCSRKSTKRPVLVFLEIPTVCFFRNRSGVTANFSNSFSFN